MLTRADETNCLPGWSFQESPGHPDTVSSHATSKTESRAGIPWEGTVEEALRALLHGSRSN